MYQLYNLALLLASPFLLCYAFLKGLPFGNSLKSLAQRLGSFSPDVMGKLRGGDLIWMHAVSVGEVRAAQPLIRSLRAQYPSCRIVLSSTTFTGHQVASEVAGVDLVVFFPFDLPLIVNRALNRLKPRLIVIIETEIWPNFIRCADRKNIPLILANGRISKKSLNRYLLVKKTISRLLNRFTSICVQDMASARRFKMIGAPVDRLHVTGNLKFDFAEHPLPIKSFAAALQSAEGLKERYIWVGGSTRSGEHELLLECHQRLCLAGLPSFLIIAPRHPGRCSHVAELLKTAAIPFALRSEMKTPSEVAADCQVLLVDTVGELKDFYAIADVVFVGGSLVPKGGHNVLEPSCQGKPVLFGPHMFNFMEISQWILKAGAGYRVRDVLELQQMLERLYDDEALRQKMGNAGLQLISRKAGATERTMAKIAEQLGP